MDSSLFFLRSPLPVSVNPYVPCHLWCTGHYRNDPSVAPKVIRASRLLGMHELLPWAFYFLSVHSEPGSRHAQARSLSKEDVALHESCSVQLAEVRRINIESTDIWNQTVTKFMSGQCHYKGGCVEVKCLRQSMQPKLNETSFILTKELEDPLHSIYEVTTPGREYLCLSCYNDVAALANCWMLDVLKTIQCKVLNIDVD